MGERLAAVTWVAWTALRMQQREMRGNPLVVIGAVVQPAVFLLVVIGARRVTDPDTATRLVSAVALTTLWSATVWLSGGILRRERAQGTLAASMTAVHPPQLVLAGKAFGATVYSTAAILASTTATVALLGTPVRLGGLGWLAVGLLMVVLSGTALGMLMSCLFLLTRHGPAWSGALMYPVFILGGLLIPPALLPDWLSWLSSAVSLRWINEYLVGAATGAPRPASLAVAAALTLAYLLVAVWSLRRAGDRARREGTLDLG